MNEIQVEILHLPHAVLLLVQRNNEVKMNRLHSARHQRHGQTCSGLRPSRSVKV